MNTTQRLTTRVCIAGGGPAGMMTGYLLARAGIETLVLEKHADFLRDFRGDTVHPSTLDVLAELGLLETFLQRPHQKLHEIIGRIGGETVHVADFTHLPTRCKFVALMPQWDFLDVLASAGRSLPQFQLSMCTEVTDVLSEGGIVTGVLARTASGEREIRAELTIGADGRHSIVRERAGLEVIDLGSEIDVLWMKLSKAADDPAQALGNFNRGHVFVMLDRGDYWQCAYVIQKGAAQTVKHNGLPAFREELLQVVPALGSRVAELTDWQQIKTLSVRIDRLSQWSRAGLLCIGDSAHAMSPIGGVGINLAIQDAVAAANALVPVLRRGRCTQRDLATVQTRREWPTRVTQSIQKFIQQHMIGPALERSGPTRMPWPARLLNARPALRRLPARFVGLGARPEHVGSWLQQPGESRSNHRVSGGAAR